MLEPDLRVRIHNRAFRAAVGHAAEELAGAQPHFRDVLEYNRRRGIYGVADDGWDDYVGQRLEEVRRARACPTEWRLADGRMLEYQCVPLPDGGRMLTYYDLTHLKRIEEALKAAKEEAEQASRTKSEFLANMSHELRTPMNAIIGFTRLVMRRGKEVLPEKQYANLEKILVSANHLLGLINDVLDLSKVEAGRMEVKPVEFALEPLLDQCLRTSSRCSRSGRVELVKQVEPGLPTLFSDQDKLRQILFNLLSNAAKFTEAGTITVAARRHGDELVDRGRRHRHRHPRRPARAGVRGVPPGRQQQHAAVRRHRAWACRSAGGSRSCWAATSRWRARRALGSTFTLTVPLRHAAALPDAPP